MNPKKNVISIALASDNNYAIPLGITIFSILYNKKSDYDIDFFILEDQISNEEKERIKSMVNSYMSSITFLSVDNFLTDNFLPEIGYLKKISYARIFIPELIKRSKIIYLDTDIIVNDEIIDLFNKDFESPFLAVEEPDAEKILKNKKDFRLKKYFNAGILLINTKKWKENNITEKCLKFIKEYPEKIEYADQDALNYTCQNLWGKLDRKYNYEIVYNEPNKSRDPVITHYIGNIKPWHYEYPNKIDLYRKYAQMSPWKDKWRTKVTINKIYIKSCLRLKLILKMIPGLKKIVVKIKTLIHTWKEKK